DVDFIKLRPTAAGILKVDIDAYAGAGSVDVNAPVDAVVRLFAADGELLASNDDGPDGVDPLLYYDVVANTDYFMAVSGKGNDTFDPFLLGSGGHGDTGEYAFSASVLPASQEQALTDDSASDGGVRTLALGTQVTDRIGDDGGFARGDTDVDVFKFVAPYAGEFTFDAAPPDEYGVDTYLRVFDADGTQLAADDNGAGKAGGSRITLRLAAGQTYLVGVSGAGTDAAAYDPIAGTGAGSGDTGGYVLGVTAGSRDLTFDAAHRATYTDANGSLVTVTLKGPGSGSIVFASAGNVDASTIALTGATDHTTLSIKGDTTVDNVVVTGALNGLAAKTADLVGSLSVTGSARSVALRNVTGAVMSVGAASDLTFGAAAVSDSSLAVAGTIRSLKVTSWADTDASGDRITAGRVVAATSRGDFAATLVADAVGKVTVGGALTGEVRSAGNIDAVSAHSFGPGASVFAGVAADFAGLPDAADDFANPAAVLKSLAVKGTFAASYVAAPTIIKASLGSVATENGGTVFGLAADVVTSVTGSFDGTKFRYRNLADASQTVVSGDAVLRVI
ncbi:MAG: hypothetical protein JWO31_2268, partial [Phycisphaerales bacterium]|nr:hypothetical protein [Phycisphaerales bacterium]